MTSVDSAARASAFERRRYLDDMVALLWPLGEPAEQDAAGVATEYVLLPNGRRPTLMLPRRPGKVAATLIRNYKTSADRRTQLKLTALSAAARVGATALLPERITVWSRPHDPDRDVGAYLSAALGREVLIGLHTSPPRANRKPILHLLNPDGESVGFAKVGVDPLTKALVRHEAATLAMLSGQTLRTFQVPQLLHHGVWNGLEILVQSPLLRGDGPDDVTRVHEAMRELAGVYAPRTEPVDGGAYVAKLRTKIESLPASPVRDVFGAALSGVVRRSSGGDPGLLLGAWHGDWTPWNMTAYADRIAVWDWERFAEGVPAGFDPIHFEMQGAIQRRRIDPKIAALATVAAAPALLVGFGLDDQQARRVAVLYLLEIGSRYVGDDQAAAGARLGNVQDWLVPALTSALTDLESRAAR